MYKLTRERAIELLHMYLVQPEEGDTDNLLAMLDEIHGEEVGEPYESMTNKELSAEIRKYYENMTDKELATEICVSGVFNQLTDGMSPEVFEKDLVVGDYQVDK